MVEEMRLDKNIYLMGEEVANYNGAYKVSLGMLDEFGPERVVDTPIAETGFSGIGIGSAMNGLRPIIEFMTFNFSLIAMDQIINGAAKIYQMSGGQFNIPIVFRGPTGNAGQLGAQHSQNFENWYANTPGLKVVIPSNPYEAKGLLKTSIRDDDPVIFMESELMYGDKGKVPENEYLIPIGKAKIVHEGNDVTLLSFGKMMKIAESAYQEAKKENISVEIINLRTVRPIDYKSVINSVKKTNRLVIIEEAWPLASISSEISHHIQRFAFDYLDAPVHRITCQDVPFHYAPTLLKEILPDLNKTMKAIKKVTYS